MKISELGVFNKNDHCAWVGGGGKTSLIFALSTELYADKCLISTTTKMTIDEGNFADHFYGYLDPNLLETNDIEGIYFIYKEKSIVEPSKIVGFSDRELLPLSQKLKVNNIPFQIESDGSKRKPLKFPADHEPNIPTFVDKVCVVVGLSVLGKELLEENVHRSNLFSKFLDLSLGSKINLDHLFLLLSHPEGGLKNIPPTAEKVLFLNQAELIKDKSGVNNLILKLKRFYDHIFLSNVTNNQLEIIAHWGKIGCVVLAAGSSARFGSPKQLALFRNKTFIENVIETVLKINFAESVVILGYFYEKISQVIKQYKINIVINPDWENGQSKSVIEGVKFFTSKNVEAVLFLLVDQPQITVDQIHDVINLYAYKKPPIIVHNFEGQNRHPILFSKLTFSDLTNLEGDQGGRQLFDNFPVEKIKIKDQYYSIDVDTINDLEKLGNE
ncbi:MAG TPA: selenium cofactor biosynthesis protein YqeC [Anaerolineaceae bacterium]|nr:selenium cofactor biosynthesis protein YqeC [Anaerolineaceae bacterium]